jgi:hypothetical protein
MNTIIAIAVIAALVVAAVFLVRAALRTPASAPNQGHNHDHGDDGCGCAHGDQGKADDGEFHAVHRGKDTTGGCKFNPDEVRRTRFRPTPPIDVTNLPAKDARIVAAHQGVTVAGITDMLNQLTGEVSTVINGKTVKIASRNTHNKQLNDALDWVEARYKALGIAVKRAPYTVRGKKLENIVAEIPGAKNPSKIVIVSGHLDSTVGNPWSNENVAPGADDDASGTVGVLEVARALKDHKLDYTVRFVHFTGEEQGLWGSYKYSDQCAAAKEDIVGVFQMDMIGYCRKPGNRVDIHDGEDANGSHELVVALTRAAAQYNLDLNVVDTHNHAVDNRSDHAGFIDHGYKAVLISIEFTDDGFDVNYHTRNDRVSEMNLPYMVEIIRMTIAAVSGFAKIQ